MYRKGSWKKKRYNIPWHMSKDSWITGGKGVNILPGTFQNWIQSPWPTPWRMLEQRSRDKPELAFQGVLSVTVITGREVPTVLQIQYLLVITHKPKEIDFLGERPTIHPKQPYQGNQSDHPKTPKLLWGSSSLLYPVRSSFKSFREQPSWALGRWRRSK